jgi:type I restriction-modification system DNA methylase subunit
MYANPVIEAWVELTKSINEIYRKQAKYEHDLREQRIELEILNFLSSACCQKLRSKESKNQFIAQLTSSSQLPSDLLLKFDELFIQPFSFSSDEFQERLEYDFTPAAIGLIFEHLHLEQQKSTRQTGVFYSPEPEINCLVRCALDAWFGSQNSKKNPNPTLRIIDPACGTGDFLVHIIHLLMTEYNHEFGHDGGIAATFPEEILIMGIDIDTHAVRFAEFRLNQILESHPEWKNMVKYQCVRGDFLVDSRAQKHNFPKFDLVIGNPPYVRPRDIASPNHPDGKQRTDQEYRSVLLATIPSLSDPPDYFDGHSDYYLYFFYHGIEILAPNGILGFITSNSWMNVRFGFPFQKYLCEKVRVRYCMDNISRSFAHAEINTVITILQKPGIEGKIDGWIPFLQWKKPYIEITNPPAQIKSLIQEIDQNQAKIQFLENEWVRMVLISPKKLLSFNRTPHSKNKTPSQESNSGFQWGNYFFTASPIYFDLMERIGDEAVFLGDIATIRRGITTNCNDFFILTDVDNQGQIKSEGIKEFVNGVGDHHPLETEYLQKILVSPKQIEKPLLKDDQIQSYLLFTDQSKSGLETRNATKLLKYIQYGEKVVFRAKKGTIKGTDVIGVHSLPTFKGKYEKSPDRWFCLKKTKPGTHTSKSSAEDAEEIEKSEENIDSPSAQAGRIFFQKIYNTTYKLVYVTTPILGNNTFYEVILAPRYQNQALDIFRLLLGSITMLCLEINGRTNFGGGALDTATFDIEKIIIPNPEKITTIAWQQIRTLTEPLLNRSFFSAEQEFQQQDRQQMDEQLFKLMNLPFNSSLLYHEILRIQQIRTNRAKTFKSKNE